MAQRVVDHLEQVQVQAQQPERHATDRLVDRTRQRPVESAAVGQAGQRVQRRRLAQQRVLAVQFQHRPGAGRQIGQVAPPGRVQPARRAVDHAQRADRLAILRQDRRAGVEAHLRIAHHQGVVGEALIRAGVLHHHHLLRPQDGMGAERQLARSLRHIQAVPGLEPLPAVIHQRDQRDRHRKMLRRQFHQPVEARIRRRVQHADRRQTRQAERFVDGLSGTGQCGTPMRTRRTACRPAQVDAMFYHRLRQPPHETMD